MSLRADLKTILSDFAIQAWAAKGIIHPGPTADKILAAIEAERFNVQTVAAYDAGFQAGKEVERERLAKAAEELADLWRSGCKIMDDAYNDERHFHADQLEFVANWIRSRFREEQNG